jgi:hypothetical protein
LLTRLSHDFQGIVEAFRIKWHRESWRRNAPRVLHGEMSLLAWIVTEHDAVILPMFTW